MTIKKLLLLILILPTCACNSNNNNSSNYGSSETFNHSYSVNNVDSHISSVENNSVENEDLALSSSVDKESSNYETSTSESLNQSSSYFEESLTSSIEDEKPRNIDSEELYRVAHNLEIDSKGTKEGELVTIKATCVFKFGQENFFFADQKGIFQVYKDNDIYKDIIIFEDYEYQLIGRVAKYLYKPQLQLVSCVRLEKNEEGLNLSRSNTQVAPFLKMSREDDSSFSDIYHFEGYIGADTSNSSKIKYAIIDNFNDRVVAQSSYSSKALYIANYDSREIDEKLYDYYNEEVIVSLDFMLYAYNTQYKTWQIIVLSDTILVE